MIYEFIQHRYERSTAAGRQVHNDEALVTFVSEVLDNLPAEKTLTGEGPDDDPIWVSSWATGQSPATGL